MKTGIIKHPVPFGDSFAEPHERGEARPHKTIRVRDKHRVHPIVRVAFYGFLATIPFETVDLGIGTEITVISLALLLLSLVFQIDLVFKKPPAAYFLFLVFALIFAMPVYLSTPRIYFEEAQWQMFVLFQVVIMSWIAFNILKYEKAARGALITFIIACTLLCVMQLIGVSGTAVDTSGSSERVTALGFHPNNIARILGLALLSLAGLVYAIRKSHFKTKWWIVPVIALLGLTIVQTGSRGALLALAAGFFVFVLKEGAASTKFRNAALIGIAVIFFFTLVYQSEMNRTRFEEAVNEGKLARRETIYPIAFDMFMERPLFGWGAKASEYELGARLAHIEEDSKNPHNLILFALVGTGLFGTIPLVAGILLAVATAWKSRRGIRGVLPLALIVLVVVANMSGVWLTNKMHWFVMAYALSAPYVTKRRKKKILRALPKRGRIKLTLYLKEIENHA